MVSGGMVVHVTAVRWLEDTPAAVNNVPYIRNNRKGHVDRTNVERSG